MPLSRTIIIAGAGIGGLTAALALAARGFRAVVLERAERLEEVGAGLQLSPNATRVLIGLGLDREIAARAITPDAVTVMTAREGGEVCRIPLGEAATARYGAPYRVIHRADLQAALLAKAKDHQNIDLRLGAQFEDVVGSAAGVTVIHRSGDARRQDMALALIGADGVWSAVRGHVAPGAQPAFTGRIAWRGTVAASDMPNGFDARRVQLWMGPNAHLVAYPMRGGQRINVVAIVTGTWNRPGWNEIGDPAEVAAQFSGPRWPDAVRAMIGAVDGWRKWALFGFAAHEPWAKDKIALLGDAAHAMLPFVAQGAAMAIEDAAVIARCLAGAPDARAAFARYEAERRPRVLRVQRAARQAGRIYHLAGPAAWARDITMRTLGGARLLARQDWIYDWRE